MSGGKGGSTTSQVEIPAWLENAAIENINRARAAQQIGYAPYYGPDVAAFTPMQAQAMQATGSAAQAFGLAPQGFDATAGIPQAQTYAGGLMGYSSAPLFEESLQTFRDVRPAQAAAMESMFIDPYGDAAGYTPMSYAPTQQQLAQTAYQERANEAAAQRAHELAMAQYQPDQSTNITVDPNITFDPQFINEGATVTGGTMAMDQGPITVQTEQGPVTVDPTMGFNPVFDPSYTGGSTNIDYSATSPDVIVSGLDGSQDVVYYDDDYMVTMPYDTAPIVGSIGPEESIAAGSGVDPYHGQVLTEQQKIQAKIDDMVASGVDYNLAVQVANTPTELVPAGGTVHPMGDQPAMYAGGMVDIVSGAGLPPQDIGLMDVLKTGMNVTPMNLGSALLTGSILSPNTDPIPVVEQSTPTAALPPVSNNNADLVTAMASQGPTGTYNQAYWAEKLASGATQAELKAEQDEIAAAGGKVYTGSTPQETTTTSASGSGK